MSHLSNKKIAVIVVLLFALGLTLTACGTPQETEPGDTETGEKEPVEEPQVLVFGNTEIIESLLPELTTGSSYSTHARIFAEGLFRIDPKTNEPTPSVAEDWEVSEDGKVYTIYLRKGVQWHKGYGELTAEDVAFTFNRHIDPNVDSVHSGQFWMLDSVEVVDDYTVKFHLNAPFGGFLYNITLMHPGWGALISQKAFEDLGKEGYNKAPVGAGPYVFNADEWVPREVVVYDAFEGYFRGAPEIERIEARVITDETTRAMAMQAGEVHITSLQDPAVYGEYKDVETLIGYAIDEIHIAKLDLNTQKPPLDKVEVRRAIAHAVDTQGLIDGVFEGQALRPNCNILHPEMANVDSAPFEPFDYDVELTKELLAEVGLKPSDIHMEGCTYSSSIYAKVAEFLNTGFQNAGLDITIKPLERGALHAQRADPENDMVMIAHPRWPDPDPFLSLIHGNAIPPNGINFTWWDKADDLIDKSRTTQGEERTQVLTEIQQLLCEEVPQLPLWHRRSFWLVSNKVKGFVDGPGAYFFPYELSLEE